MNDCLVFALGLTKALQYLGNLYFLAKFLKIVFCQKFKLKRFFIMMAEIVSDKRGNDQPIFNNRNFVTSCVDFIEYMT